MWYHTLVTKIAKIVVVRRHTHVDMLWCGQGAHTCECSVWAGSTHMWVCRVDIWNKTHAVWRGLSGDTVQVSLILTLSLGTFLFLGYDCKIKTIKSWSTKKGDLTESPHCFQDSPAFFSAWYFFVFCDCVWEVWSPRASPQVQSSALAMMLFTCCFDCLSPLWLSYLTERPHPPCDNILPVLTTLTLKNFLVLQLAS